MRPLEKTFQLLDRRSADIEAWFAEKWQGVTPLPYFSCDVRHSAWKIGVVDTNLFPGGFNNLCNAFTTQTAQAFDLYFKNHYPQAQKIAILAEAHTRNKFYLLNVLKLQSLICKTGRDCRVTMPHAVLSDAVVRINLDINQELEIHRPDTESGSLRLGEWQADLIVSNNDFTSGVPEEFAPVADKIIPDPRLGWQRRIKSEHFRILSEIIHDFAQRFDFDPWLIKPYTRVTQDVTEDDLSKLTHTVHNVLLDIQKKYDEYGIQEQPYVFIKNDSGTYGLGITSVFSADELTKMNRKRRGKLFSSKAGVPGNRFIVQEGIPTADTYSDFPIEPVIYGVGREPIGGFFRIHEGKNQFESLNSPGMHFACLCLHKLDEPHEAAFINCFEKEKLVGVSRFLARFAALAAALEKRDLR